MNVYLYSFFDLELGEAICGMTVAPTKESVLTTVGYKGYKPVCITVRPMPDFRKAISADGMGSCYLDSEKVRQISRELLIRRGTGEL